MRAVALAGVPATLAMDVGALGLFAPLFGTKGLGPGNLGRWIGHLRRGRIRHDDIAAAPPIAHEVAIGVVAHYATGLTLGAAYGLLLRARRSPQGTLAAATGFGIATSALAWFLVLPACGLGAMGMRRGGLRLPAFTLCNHATFGVSLGAASRLAARRRAGQAAHHRRGWPPRSAPSWWARSGGCWREARRRCAVPKRRYSSSSGSAA
jgi:Protein of unknown function (DUF2938)